MQAQSLESLTDTKSGSVPTTILYHVSREPPAVSQDILNMFRGRRKVASPTRSQALKVQSALFGSTPEDIETRAHGVQENFHNFVSTGHRVEACQSDDEFVESRIDTLKRSGRLANYHFLPTKDVSLVQSWNRFDRESISGQTKNENVTGSLILGTSKEGSQQSVVTPGIYVRPDSDPEVMTQRQNLLNTFAEAYMTRKTETGNRSTVLADEMKKSYVGCRVHQMDIREMNEFCKLGFLQYHVPSSAGVRSTNATSSSSNSRERGHLPGVSNVTAGQAHLAAEEEGHQCSSVPKLTINAPTPAQADGPAAQEWDNNASFEDVSLDFM